MNVLSLFDGISCARLALSNINIKPTNYFASEVNKHAIKVSNNNWNDVTQLGDVCNIQSNQLPNIDLLIGGSPCQDLSSANLTGKGLNGIKSKLLYEYIRLLNELKPKYFLLENVNSMKQCYKDIITELTNVKPILINSNLLTAQNRSRLYWTNISNITQPIDMELYLKDIIQYDVDVSMHYSPIESINKLMSRKPKWKPHTLDDKASAVLSTYRKVVFPGTILHWDDSPSKCRRLSEIEYERLQGLPDDYTKGISSNQRYIAIGNGFTIPVISYILSFIR